MSSSSLCVAGLEFPGFCVSSSGVRGFGLTVCAFAVFGQFGVRGALRFLSFRARGLRRSRVPGFRVYGFGRERVWFEAPGFVSGGFWLRMFRV